MKAYLAINKGHPRFNDFFPEETLRYVESFTDLQFAEGKNVTTESIAREIDPDTDIYVTLWGSPRLDAEILEAAPNIKLLVHLAGTVVPFVSPAMWDKGIRAMSGNYHFAKSVAEGCVAYMLAAQRRIPNYANDFKYRQIGKGLGTNAGILDKTIGIVSLGMIASYLIEMLQPFHPKLKVYSRRPISDELISLGCEQTSLEDIFSTCDIISLQTSYNEHTHHMFGADLFKLIKPGALLMNTARGKIVDEAALIEELRDGRFTAFLDVYEQEPPAQDSALYDLPNVYMMPHRGGPTTDRCRFITRDLFTDAYEYVTGKRTDLRFEITRAKAETMTDR